MLHRDRCGHDMDKAIGDDISMEYGLVFLYSSLDEANKINKMR